MKKLLVWVFTSLLMLSFLGCSSSINEIEYDMPEEGTWYCSELRVHLVFDIQYQAVKNSYAVIEDTEITCYCDGEYNTPYIYLICRKSAGGYSPGDMLYWWSVIEMSDDQMILEDYHTGEHFIFNKVSLVLD